MWHRPLGQVIEEAARSIAIGATTAALATLSIGKKKERALTVVAPNGARTEPARAPPGSLALIEKARSAGLVCLQWFMPARPAARVPTPTPSRPPASVPPLTRPSAFMPQSQPPKPQPPFAPFAPLSTSVARPAARADTTATDAVPLTRPSGVRLDTFTQKLFADSTQTLLYDPNGMGSLWAQTASGHKSVAGPEAKWYFLAVLKRFEELGEPSGRNNPKYAAMTKSFSEALLAHAPSDPIWKQIVSDDPRHVARCFAGIDKPQHVIVDIPPSSIHRLPQGFSANAGDVVVSA